MVTGSWGFPKGASVIGRWLCGGKWKPPLSLGGRKGRQCGGIWGYFFPRCCYSMCCFCALNKCLRGPVAAVAVAFRLCQKRVNCPLLFASSGAIGLLCFGELLTAFCGLGFRCFGPGIWMVQKKVCLFTRSLVADSGPDISGDGMPYWPRYSEISPSSRAAYLDWLATGHSDLRYGVGHVFLYFYGLERRFFIDSPGPQERRVIINEVDRLLQIYGNHRSVRRYFESFLDAARASLATDDELKPRFWTAGYELPLGLRVALGRRASDGLPLNADWALSWYCAHPDYTLRTAASRAFPEFQALFSIFFAERYPVGMKIPLPKRTLRAQYQAASSEFEVGLEEYIGALPDMSRITQPLNTTRSLVEEATDSLDKYSRFLGRNPNGRRTIEAHALLPERLRGCSPALRWTVYANGPGKSSTPEACIPWKRSSNASREQSPKTLESGS